MGLLENPAEKLLCFPFAGTGGVESNEPIPKRSLEIPFENGLTTLLLMISFCGSLGGRAGGGDKASGPLAAEADGGEKLLVGLPELLATARGSNWKSSSSSDVAAPPARGLKSWKSVK